MGDTVHGKEFLLSGAEFEKKEKKKNRYHVNGDIILHFGNYFSEMDHRGLVMIQSRALHSITFFCADAGALYGIFLHVQ